MSIAPFVADRPYELQLNPAVSRSVRNLSARWLYSLWDPTAVVPEGAGPCVDGRPNSLSDHPTARAACVAAGVDRSAQRLPMLTTRALTTLADTDMISGKGPVTSTVTTAAVGSLVDQFAARAWMRPICLTWELTYACNLSCVHCLSSSGRRDPRELSARQECQGGHRRTRADAGVLREHRRWRTDGATGLLGARRLRHSSPRRGEVLDQRREDQPERWPSRLAASDYVDVQISLDGATAEVNDYGARGRLVRQRRSGRCRTWPTPDSRGFKISVVCTRQNIDQLDAFKAIADKYQAQLRLTRLRPSGRGADVWDELHPTAAQQRVIYDWLLAQRRAGPHRRFLLPPRRVR